MRKTIDLSLPFKAFSTNDLYQGRKVRSYKYKTFRKNVLTFLEENYEQRVDLKGNLSMSLEIGYSSPLSDASNGIKGIEDVVAEYFKFNDRQIVTILIEKYLVDKGKEYMRLKIRKTTKDIDKRTKKRRIKK